MSDAALHPHDAPPALSATPGVDRALEVLGRRALITIGVVAVLYHFLIATPLGLPRVSVEELYALGAIAGLGVVGRTAEAFAPARRRV